MKLITSILFFLLASINIHSNLVAAQYPEDRFQSGHSVYVTKSTDDTTWWKLELLRNAKQTIEMSAGFAGGDIFLKVLAIFQEQLAKNPNIQIHLMISQNSGLLSDGEKSQLSDLAKRYPNNLHFQVNSPSGLMIQAKGVYTTENHMKIIIIDEKYFLLGGTNLIDNQSHGLVDQGYKPDRIQDAFLPRASRDMDVVISGSMAKVLREEFFQIYELFKSGKSLRDNAGPIYFTETRKTPVKEEGRAVLEAFERNPEVVKNANVYGLVSGPRFQNHLIGQLYDHYVSSAEYSIDLAHMYFFPIDKIYNHLVDAAKRNIRINVITNGVRLKSSAANASFATYVYINRVNYVPIIFGRTFNFWQKDDAKKAKQNDTKIYEFNVDYTLFHKKVMVVDNRYSMIGSYNLGKKSENSDFEVEVVIDSIEVADKILEVLENDKKLADTVTVNQAIDWHFSFFYNMMKAFESFFFDGIILSVDQIPQGSDYNFDELDPSGFEGKFKEFESFEGFELQNDFYWER